MYSMMSAVTRMAEATTSVMSTSSVVSAASVVMEASAVVSTVVSSVVVVIDVVDMSMMRLGVRVDTVMRSNIGGVAWGVDDCAVVSCVDDVAVLCGVVAVRVVLLVLRHVDIGSMMGSVIHVGGRLRVEERLRANVDGARTVVWVHFPI